jgi:hypothetical protein
MGRLLPKPFLSVLPLAGATRALLNEHRTEASQQVIVFDQDQGSNFAKRCYPAFGAVDPEGMA